MAEPKRNCRHEPGRQPSAVKFLILLIVDRAIAIGYTPFSAAWRKHFPATRDGLDAIPSKDRPVRDRMGSCASAD